LPGCVNDGELFLEFGLGVLDIKPKDCEVFCSEEDFLSIATKVKNWEQLGDDETQAPDSDHESD